MKQLQLDLKERLLIVEYNEKIEIESVLEVNTDFEKGVLKEKKFIAVPGNLKFICKGPDLTEDIAKGFIDCIDEKFYTNYKSDKWRYTALASFISAIESKGYHWGENPHEKEVDSLAEDNSANGCDKYRKAFHEWQEAESRTFNPSKCLIFKLL